MAKIYLNRLAKKYGIDPNNVSGINYQTLMKDILARNTKNIAETTAKLSDEHWNKSLNRVKRAKRFVLPDMSEVIPSDTIFIKKGAESGTLITNTLRDKLSEDLTNTLNEFRTAKTGEQAFIRRRGTEAGTINPEVVKLFQDKIRDTFENYTKKDPRFGIPSNIKTIAVTEARGAINDIKDAYTKNLLKKNDNIKMKKQWKQNKMLAKKPRQGHSAVHGQIIDYNEKFLVPLFDTKGNLVETTPMDRPHDPKVRAEQVIGCNCDIEYYAEVL